MDALLFTTAEAPNLDVLFLTLLLLLCVEGSATWCSS